MKDIFDAKIMCKNCDVQMEQKHFDKNGFVMRAVECPKCKNKIIHPVDLANYSQYSNLKNKTYSVKLRVVGNSHAVTIPNEIIDFINEMNHDMNRRMNEMVKLCFEDFGKLSLCFVDKTIEEKNKWQ